MCADGNKKQALGVKPETMRELCEAAMEFRALEPWVKLYDSDLFGIVDPVTQQLRLGCVLGNAGEVFGLAMYRGEAGLRWVLNLALRDAEIMRDPDYMYEMDALKMEFCSRSELSAKQKAVFKQIGFKPSLKAAYTWPVFQSMKPGRFSAMISQEEAELFLSDLRKAVDFVKLTNQEADIFEGRAAEEVPVYPSNPDFKGPLQMKDLEWHTMLPPEEKLPGAVKMPEEELKAVQALPLKKNLTLEVDCFYSPMPVADGKGEACFPWMLMAVDVEAGMIVGAELAKIDESTREEAAAWELIKTCKRLNARPEEIHVSRLSLIAGLGELMKSLGIELKAMEFLPGLELAQRALRGSFGPGAPFI